ncbi:MAG: DoxX family protein [Pirellulales bacterium]|nr:DoxX family protein [Pirellulales bacterium]
MNPTLQGVLTVVGRVMLSTIFLLSTAGNKIPQFSVVAENMQGEGIPLPKLMLAGAIIFLLAGSISVILGYKARVGALLLLIFLVLASYFYHDFWAFDDVQRKQQEVVAFMKNMAMIGAMLLIIANGAGPMSLDNRCAKQPAEE